MNEEMKSDWASSTFASVIGKENGDGDGNGNNTKSSPTIMRSQNGT